MKICLLSLALSSAALSFASAEVSFPKLLSDHTVLQRE